MKLRRLLPGLLLFALAAEPGDLRILERFRLRQAPAKALRGWIKAWDEAGFDFIRPGNRARRRFSWNELVPEDARRMRIALHLDPVPSSGEPRRVPGHRLHFHGDRRVTAEGLLVETDRDAGVYLFKQKGVVWRYPQERVKKIEERLLDERKIYSADEIYTRELERRRPTNAYEHRLLAERLRDAGDFSRALQHYQEALKANPGLQRWLQPEIDRLEAVLEDKETAAVLKRATWLFNQRGDRAGALRLLDEYAKRNPDRARVALRLKDQLEERHESRIEREFRIRKHRAVERLVEKFLTSAPDLATARTWATREFPKLLQERMQKEMGLDRDGYEELLERRSKGTPHFATYWSGSHVVNRRAHKPDKRGRGDPERWWASYGRQVKETWLKAYMAEKLHDIFTVVRVKHIPCDRCGGTGKVRKMSFRAGKGQPSEWKETCPRCNGVGKDRSVAYR